MLEKSKPLASKVTRKEFIALKFLKVNKEIKIVQSEEGYYKVVLNESTYKKVFCLLESGVYKILRKDLKSQIEMNIRKLLTNHKTALPSALNYKLTPYYSKPLYLYRLPEIHTLTSP
jgi:hypothetical protein